MENLNVEKDPKIENDQHSIYCKDNLERLIQYRIEYALDHFTKVYPTEAEIKDYETRLANEIEDRLRNISRMKRQILSKQSIVTSTTEIANEIDTIIIEEFRKLNVLDEQKLKKHLNGLKTQKNNNKRKQIKRLKQLAQEAKLEIGETVDTRIVNKFLKILQKENLTKSNKLETIRKQLSRLGYSREIE